MFVTEKILHVKLQHTQMTPNYHIYSFCAWFQRNFHSCPSHTQWTYNLSMRFYWSESVVNAISNKSGLYKSSYTTVMKFPKSSYGEDHHLRFLESSTEAGLTLFTNAMGSLSGGGSLQGSLNTSLQIAKRPQVINHQPCTQSLEQQRGANEENFPLRINEVITHVHTYCIGA